MNHIERQGVMRMCLERQNGFNGTGLCVFIMLNPSTADDTVDDPTIKRCKKFAWRWGYRRLRVVNTNPMRSTDPKLTPIPDELVLDSNDAYLRQAMTQASRVVLAWGNNVNDALEQRTLRVIEPWVDAWPGLVWHLGLTKLGKPKHPLYLREDTVLQPYGVR